MNFEESYHIIKNKFLEADLSKIDRNFSGEVCFTDEQKHYIYAAYIDKQKIIEPVKHTNVDISVKMSLDTAEQLLNKQIDPFKAFTTGKVKAKGNIFLALSLYKKFKGN